MRYVRGSNLKLMTFPDRCHCKNGFEKRRWSWHQSTTELISDPLLIVSAASSNDLQVPILIRLYLYTDRCSMFPNGRYLMLTQGEFTALILCTLGSIHNVPVCSSPPSPETGCSPSA